MPRGTDHDLAGLLLWDGYSLVLRVDDGGEWRLDTANGARRLTGRRVRVTGTRDGFDLLAVRSIEALGRHAGGSVDQTSGMPSVTKRAIRGCMSALFPNRS